MLLVSLYPAGVNQTGLFAFKFRGKVYGWDHLAGTTSAPFEAGEHGQIAVKVIDDRGNELMVVTDLKE